jgi:general secretion pathway protein I
MRRYGAGHRRTGGFTLLEVMIALMIAGFSLALLYDAVSDSITGVRIAGDYAEALSRARSHLAAIGRNPLLVVGRHDGDDGSGFHWHLVVEPVPGESDPTGYTVYDCSVVISWAEGAVPRQVTLETRRLGALKTGPTKAAP